MIHHVDILVFLVFVLPMAGVGAHVIAEWLERADNE